jgi:protein TonB
MTVAALSRISQPRCGPREAGLWASAAAIVLAAHVAVAYAVQNLSFAETQDGGPPPALAVEMAPLVIAPACRKRRRCWTRRRPSRLMRRRRKSRSR